MLQAAENYTANTSDSWPAAIRQLLFSAMRSAWKQLRPAGAVSYTHLDVYKRQPGSLSSVADFKGVVKYEGVENFTAQSTWTITKIHVNENQTVKKGDLLFEIDMDEANILILQQRASIKQMEEKKKEAQTTQEASVVQLQLEAETQKLALLEKQYPADGKMVAQDVYKRQVGRSPIV